MLQSLLPGESLFCNQSIIKSKIKRQKAKEHRAKNIEHKEYGYWLLAVGYQLMEFAQFVAKKRLRARGQGLAIRSQENCY
ncbi:MAG TPA: hypothetical protein DEF47_04845 [Herpetosiphon sp.]|nr:hypothetical protein [Herpetosiphon sp.]